MGDEMLNVFYSSEFLHPHRMEKNTLSNGLKSHRLRGEPQFRLFRDYFGLINLVQNTRLMEKENIQSLHEFAFQKRERVGSVDSDRSFTSDSSSATTELDLNFENYGRKTPSPSLAPGTPVKVIRRGDLTESNRNRKNKSEGRRNRNVNVCVFCRNNGESKKVYSSHVLKDTDGNTTCPILRAYTCPLCKCSGDQSHTIKYCPQNKNIKQEK